VNTPRRTRPCFHSHSDRRRVRRVHEGVCLEAKGRCNLVDDLVANGSETPTQSPDLGISSFGSSSPPLLL